MNRDFHCLCVNMGSSSLKLAVYRVDHGNEHCLARGAALEIGHPESRLEVGGRSRARALPDHGAALDALLKALAPGPVSAVGHRVVHGGDHTRPERVTPDLLQRLEALTPLAPLHNPPALAGIRAIAERWPQTPQVACFDTAFHATLPEEARTLPLARRWRERGIRRYGFHGLSYEYIVRRLGEKARGRLVIAHLGNGASLAAVRDGRSIDTSMGLTPTGGIPMSTRSGDLDPGVLLHLLREQGLDAKALERAVNREAGLLGLSGEASDMALLLASASAEARLAISVFAYQIRKTIGAYAAALGGLDRLVFTGGIGEHAAPVRWAICRGLEYLGIALDPAANSAHAELISPPQARCPVHVIHTDEDAMIARHTFELMEASHA